MGIVGVRRVLTIEAWTPPVGRGDKMRGRQAGSASAGGSEAAR